MACDVNEVVITASARTPGVRKSIRVAPPVSSSIPVTFVSPTSTSTGTMIVTSSCSPLRRIARASNEVCARTR